VRWLAPTLALLFVAIVGACGANPRAELVVHFDAGSDAPGDVAIDEETGSPIPADASPYLGGPCVDDAQCNDNLACTYDSCDQSVGRCLNVPDDTQCQDGVYCDGMELCVPGHGCEPGAVVSCDNGDACKIATCVEATKSCAYTERDVDGDGDPDAHCAPGHDCDDLNRNVSSLHAEVCMNGIDDNCNGLIDEQPCVLPAGTTCAGALTVTAPGTFPVSTVGANDTFGTSCSVTTPTAGQNVVVAITVPGSSNVDLQVWATSSGIEVAVALDGSCGDASSELACGSGHGAYSVRALARNVAPGTYFAVVTTQSPTTLQLEVDLLSPSSPPTNVDCASATPVQAGVATSVSIVSPPTDLASACPSSDGELTYSFTLVQPQDVLIYASTLVGSGTAVIGLRAPPCTGATDELECGVAGPQPLYERNLAAGTYVVTVGATSSIDATLDVELSPPTMVPPDQTCASPPVITPNQTLDYDLSKHENAIKDGCFASGPDAAYDLTLPSASDVLLIDRFPQSESGAVSLDGLACDMTTSLGCDAEGTPARVGRRNVPAGDYRVVVADQLGFMGTVQALVRPTVAPTIIPPGGAETCAVAVDASNGGFFTGDTSTSVPDYGAGCDAPGQPPGGAPDQVLSLNLAQPQRVVLDMEGSVYPTLLDVLQGPACPGTPVTNGCYVGFGSQRSFLDLELTTGQYWIVVTGYNGGKGAWDLDVRILPP
jgi:hypothetical protein